MTVHKEEESVLLVVAGAMPPACGVGAEFIHQSSAEDRQKHLALVIVPENETLH